MVGSVKARIITVVGLLLVFACSILGTTAYYNARSTLTDNAREMLTEYSSRSANTIQSQTNEIFGILELLASNHAFKAIGTDQFSISSVRELMEQEVQRSEHKRMAVSDLNGNAVYHDGAQESLAEKDYFQKAMQGEQVVSGPVINDKDNTVDITYAVPIQRDGITTGVLILTRDGLELSSFLNDAVFGKSGMAFILDGKKNIIAHTKSEAVLYHLKNVNGTEKDADAVSSATVGRLGLKQEKDIEQFQSLYTELKDGKEGWGEFVKDGVPKYIGYANIDELQWTVVLEIDKSEVLSGAANLRNFILFLTVIVLLFALAVMYILASGISRPIKEISVKCIEMAQGNFWVSIDEKLCKRRDEVGALARNFNKIHESVSGSIRNIKKLTYMMNQNVLQTVKSAEDLDNIMTQMSEVLSGMSAGMQETAASAQEMGALSQEVESSVEGVKEKAAAGAEIASQISRKADEFRNSFAVSEAKAVSMINSTRDKVNDAIEKARSVKKVNELSKAILTIAEQTNLLALNAAIEAARAGEDGKGFAVVAEEIRKLASESKQMVEDIQNVLAEINPAVDGLISNSHELLQYVDTDVKMDYSEMLAAIEGYNQDAQVLSDVIGEFNRVSLQVLSSTKSMVNAVESVSTATNTGAAEIVDITQNIASAANDTGRVRKEMENSKESIDNLTEAVSVFKESPSNDM